MYFVLFKTHHKEIGNGRRNRKLKNSEGNNIKAEDNNEVPNLDCIRILELGSGTGALGFALATTANCEVCQTHFYKIQD